MATRNPDADEAPNPTVPNPDPPVAKRDTKRPDLSEVGVAAAAAIPNTILED